MRQYASPPLIEAPTTGSLTDDVVRNASEHGDSIAFRVRASPGDAAWRDVTAADFLRQVQGVAKGLVATGVGAGDRVALMSRTRYEWTLIDYAVWFAGAISVPVYETSSVEQIGVLLADCEPCAILVETPAHGERVREAGASCPVWTIEDDAVGRLTTAGAGVSDDDLERRRAQVTPDSVATLIYTSGTTGRPKGCMLTHANFMTELGVAVEELDALFDESSSTLLFLPLAHVFARIVQIGAVRRRVTLGHTPGIVHLVADLRSFAPTFVLAVPRVFEKLFNTASQSAAADGRGRVFDRAAETAIAYSRSLDDGGPGLLLRARHRAFDRVVYRRLRDALGGHCQHAISGGAPLGERLGHFYRGIGVTVLEGYGLTETTAAVTVNLPDALKIGTVGRPLGGTAIRVAEDGELAVRGGQVMAGYWRDEEATAAVLTEDGWLLTGDLGEIDDEGFVRVTGRKKEILVTAGGKNVAPAVLEDQLRAHALVSQAMVVGDGRPYIAALVTLDRDGIVAWGRAHGKVGNDVRAVDADRLAARLADDADLVAAVQGAVDEANRAVSQAEAIRRFVVLSEDWTEEAGQLTPSLKLRRNVVMRQLRREVDDLYAR